MLSVSAVEMAEPPSIWDALAADDGEDSELELSDAQASSDGQPDVPATGDDTATRRGVGRYNMLELWLHF